MAITNIVVVIVLFMVLPFKYGPNWWGLSIFLLVNIFAIALGKKISINKARTIITIIVYVVLMIIIPIYKEEIHHHVFTNGKEEISFEEYISTEENDINTQSPVGIAPYTTKKGFYEVIDEYKEFFNCYNIKLFEIKE